MRENIKTSPSANRLMARDQNIWLIILMSSFLLMSVIRGKSQSGLNNVTPDYVIEWVESALGLNYFSNQFRQMSEVVVAKNVSNKIGENKAEVICEANSNECESLKNKAIVSESISKEGIGLDVKKHRKIGEIIKFNALDAEYVGI